MRVLVCMCVSTSHHDEGSKAINGTRSGKLQLIPDRYQHTQIHIQQSLDVWTHVCYEPNGVRHSTSDCAAHRDAQTQTFNEAFSSICLRRLLYLLSQCMAFLLFCYYMKFQEFAAQRTVLTQTFSFDFIAYGQETGG